MQPILVIIISIIVFYIYFNISEVMANRKIRKMIRISLDDLDVDMADLNKFRGAVSPEFYKKRKLELIEEETLLTHTYPKKRGFFK